MVIGPRGPPLGYASVDLSLSVDPLWFSDNLKSTDSLKTHILRAHILTESPQTHGGLRDSLVHRHTEGSQGHQVQTNFE